MALTTAVKRVIILGIDGAGAFICEADTPYIDVLLLGGAKTNHVQTVFPSNSGECWGSLLHGVIPERHESHLNIKMERNYPITSAAPSLFQIIREAKPKDMTIFWGCRGPGVHSEADLAGMTIMDTADFS